MAKTKAFAYFRTSSLTNVGDDKDSETRQRRAIEAHAERAGFDIVGEYSDPGVSGADPIEGRPGFAALMERIKGNGVRVVIVENEDRFARGIVTQELGVAWLLQQGVTLLAADSGANLTNPRNSGEKATRLLKGTLNEIVKDMIVSRLASGRARKRAETGKAEGRKSFAEASPELVREAKRLHRRNPATGARRSLRAVSAELAKLGYLNSHGTAYSASSVSSMLTGPKARQKATQAG